ALLPAPGLGRAGCAGVARGGRPGAARGPPRGRPAAAAGDLVRLPARRHGARGRLGRAARAGPDLDGPAGGPRVRRRLGADRPRTPARAHRLQHRPRPRRRQDRLAGGQPPRPAPRGALVPAARVVRGLAGRRRGGRRPLERVVVDAARRRHRRLVGGGVRRLRNRSRLARPGATRRRGARAGGAVAARGGGARRGDAGRARLRRRDGGDARRGRRRARRGVRRHGHRRAGVRGRAGAGARPGWLSGGAYRWFRDELGSVEASRSAATGTDVYELLNDLAEAVPAGADGVLWVPALAGAMAPEWNADARAGWFGLTAAHGRAHLARALLEGNAYALRDVLEAMGAAGLEPTELVCVAGGARGGLLR